MKYDKEIAERHSVRRYLDRKIEDEKITILEKEIERLNAESGLKMRLVLDEPTAFRRMATRATGFRNAVNYIAVIGRDDGELGMKAGYCGEQIVLLAQSIGLNTCWAMMCGKKACEQFVGEGERFAIGIAVGYGEETGRPHKNRPVSDVADLTDAPEWYSRGIEAAMLAPTGVNAQKFRFERDGDTVSLTGGESLLKQIDLGIVKYHFECGAGTDSFRWR